MDSTADELRERIRAGNLIALLDPALPLHLLADGPTAEWWRDGAEVCSWRLAYRYAQRFPTAPVSEVDGWARAYLPEPRISGSHWQCKLDDLAAREPGALNGCMAVVLTRLPTPAQRTRAALDLALRLRALLPEAPAELDAALAVLERYSG